METETEIVCEYQARVYPADSDTGHMLADERKSNKRPLHPDMCIGEIAGPDGFRAIRTGRDDTAVYSALARAARDYCRSQGDDFVWLDGEQGEAI